LPRHASTISRVAAAALIGLALGGCRAESAVPASLSGAPGLEAQGTDGGVCIRPPPPPACAGDREDHCCFSTISCSYAPICPLDGERCENFACVARPVECGNDGDCVDAGGAGDTFICSAGGVCVHEGCTADSGCGPGQRCLDRACFCTSNLGCDAGQVCSGADGAGICGPPIADEADPGCSASPAATSGWLALALLTTLVLVGALRRGRRRDSE
jgi:hypothetical protein